MAKIQAPFLSLGATGQVAKTLVASTWKGIKTMRHYVKPANPRSTAQVAQREIMTAIVGFWHNAATTEAITTAWNKLALVSGKPQSGFNAFTSAQAKLAGVDVYPTLFTTPNRNVDGVITMAWVNDETIGSAEPTSYKLLVGATENKLFERNALISHELGVAEIIVTLTESDHFFKVVATDAEEELYQDVSGIYAVPEVVP